MKAKKNRGGYRKTEFGNLVKANPERAAKALRDAWASEGGSTKASQRLGISRCSFFRCARILEAAGFDVGRPSETRNPGIDTVRS
jgi:hypothetical protein